MDNHIANGQCYLARLRPLCVSSCLSNVFFSFLKGTKTAKETFHFVEFSPLFVGPYVIHLQIHSLYVFPSLLSVYLCCIRAASRYARLLHLFPPSLPSPLPFVRMDPGHYSLVVITRLLFYPFNLFSLEIFPGCLGSRYVRMSFDLLILHAIFGLTSSFDT